MVDDRLLDWLLRVRRLVLLSQSVLLGVAFATGERPVAALVVTLVVGVAEAARGVAGWRGSSVLDALALTALTTAWGEPHQPLQVFWLVGVALFATFATREEARLATAVAIAGAMVAIVLPSLAGFAASAEPPLHLAAHALTFAFGAVALDHFLGGVAGASRASAAALRKAEEDRERAVRLSALGRIAAEVAHELATPLGSVELLAEEATADPSVVPEIRSQLARCRAILDRMLARGEPVEGTTEGLDERVREWVSAWRVASPDVPVDLDVALVCGALRGSPDGWRAVLWTLLDNAKRAGPPIRVAVAPAGDGARIVVADAGEGIDPTVASRIGEPFVSGWRTGGGSGLGLYVASAFAREAGGALSVGRAAGGTEAVLVLVART